MSFCCLSVPRKCFKIAKVSLLKTFVLWFTWRFCVPHFIVRVHSHPSLGKALFLPRMCRFQWENQSLSHTPNKKLFPTFLLFSLIFCSSDCSETLYNTTTTSKKICFCLENHFLIFPLFFSSSFMANNFFRRTSRSIFGSSWFLTYISARKKVISPTLSRE